MSRHRLGGARPAALLIAGALLLAACGSDDGGDDAAGSSGTSGGGGGDATWTMVTDQAGLGDQGFNDLAYAGLETAARDLGGEAVVIESSEQAQYVPNLEQAVADGSSLTVGVGFLITDAIAEVAQAHTDSSFLLIDAVAADADGEPLANVASVTFKEQEAAYLAGIIAGETTESDTIGFVGGQEIPPVVRFLTGFEAGVASVNPDVTVEVSYVGAFDDSQKAKELAAGFYDGGADIVMEVAGLGGLGVFEEAESRGEGFWVVGTDTCKQDLAPANYLTSATKDVAGVVERTAQAVDDGSFEGGAITEGLAEDAVGVCEDTFGDLPQEVQDAVDAAREEIASGDLEVPAE